MNAGHAVLALAISVALAACHEGNTQNPAPPFTDEDLPDEPAGPPAGLDDETLTRIEELARDADPLADSWFAGDGDALLPRRLWRLTSNQVQQAINEALGLSLDLSDLLPPSPADARYDNNVFILTTTPAEVRALESVGERVFAAALDFLPSRLPCLGHDPDETCALPYLDEVAAALQRGARDDQARSNVHALFATLRKDDDAINATAGTLAYLVQSIGFLYRHEVGGALEDGRAWLTSTELVSALSYLLFGAPPDDDLLSRASLEDLRDQASLARFARKMMADDRFLGGFGAFLAQWLGYRHLAVASKDADLFPEFDPALRAAMQAEIDDFVRGVLRERKANLPSLLTTKTGFHLDALAPVYEADVRGEGDELLSRSGLLLMPGVLAARSGNAGTNPMQRASHLLDRFFCIKPMPPVGVALPPQEPEEAPRTVRERFAIHAQDPACATCHTLLDPLAFSLETYDPLGRYRTEEKGVAIDASHEVGYLRDEVGDFDSAVDLFARAALTSDVQACFTRQLFEYTFGTEPDASAEPTLRAGLRAFLRSGLDMRELLLAFITSDTFRARRAE